MVARPDPPDTGAAEASAAALGADRVGFLLSKLGFHVASGFSDDLAPLGMHPGHYGLLRYINALEGKTQQALGSALSIPPSRMVGLIDELEDRGLVERRRSPVDRRANALYLTAEGRKMLAKADVIAASREDRLCASLTEGQRTQLLRLLRRVASDQDLMGVHPGMTRE